MLWAAWAAVVSHFVGVAGRVVMVNMAAG